MEERLKQRLVGAAVLVALAVIFVPMLLSTPSNPQEPLIGATIPAKRDGEFSSRIIPLDEPETPMLDEQDAERRSAADLLPSGDRAVAPRAATRAARADQIASRGVERVAGTPLRPAREKSADAPVAWAVQLGSFSNKQNAMALRDRLRSRGYAAFVESAVSDRGEVTRVFVGPELERDKAVHAIELLREETKLKGIVVRYPSG